MGDEQGDEISRQQYIGAELRVHCPRCNTPVEVDFAIETGAFADCPNDDCDAILTHKVKIETVAVDTVDEAKEVFEWIHAK